MEKSVRCNCLGGEHYLNFYKFEDEPQIYVDLLAKQPMSLKQKIKEIINILTGKEPCYDGIILDKNKSREIIEFLQKL